MERGQGDGLGAWENQGKIPSSAATTVQPHGWGGEEGEGSLIQCQRLGFNHAPCWKDGDEILVGAGHISSEQDMIGLWSHGVLHCLEFWAGHC